MSLRQEARVELPSVAAPRAPSCEGCPGTRSSQGLVVWAAGPSLSRVPRGESLWRTGGCQLLVRVIWDSGRRIAGSWESQ